MERDCFDQPIENTPALIGAAPTAETVQLAVPEQSGRIRRAAGAVLDSCKRDGIFGLYYFFEDVFEKADAEQNQAEQSQSSCQTDSLR